MTISSFLRLLSVLVMIASTQCSSPQSVPPSSECSKPLFSDFKFSISSQRNKTGQWVAQVRLEHGDDQGKSGTGREAGLWNVDLEQSITQCGGVQSIQLTATATAPSPKAAPSYTLHPGIGYYKFHKTAKTWDEARNICQQEGGHLVVINSEAESKVLQDLFAQVPKLVSATHNDFAYVGFHDRFVEGDQITIFGKSLNTTGFTRWAGPGQPDNAGGNENCGSVHRNGGLNDIPCPWKLVFFCEQELW